MLIKHGFTIDTRKMAEDVYYELMTDRQQAALAFGMLDVAIHDALDKAFRERIGSEYAERYGERPRDKSVLWNPKNGQETGTFGKFVAEFHHQMFLDLLDCAKQAGKLVV